MQTEYINEDYSVSLDPPSPTRYDFGTPSYNGSYNNSPFSANSDLSFDNDEIPIFADTYNPEDYDATSSLLMFPDAEYADDSRASSVDLTQHSFENMTFHSPNWSNQPLPHTKPQSPPRLLMPESDTVPPPTINAPDDDAENAGPKLRIVPATPVSGGGGNQVMPFMRGTSNLQPPVWEQSQTESAPVTPPSSSSPSPSQPFTFPARTPSPGDGSGSAPPTANNGFLLPNVAMRSRSKSDPPVWDQSPAAMAAAAASAASAATTVNMQDVTVNSFLSPDLNQLRRSKSEIRGHRQSRSEDYRTQLLSVPGYPSFESGMYLSPQAQEPPPSIRSMGANSLGLGFTSPSPPPAQGHFRRSSSGSRSERGISSWGGEALSGSSYASTTTSSTVRKSPYPSPNASPRPHYEELPREDQYQPSLTPSPHLGGTPLPNAPSMVNVSGTNFPLNVAKQNVTTGRTKKASHNRRKQEATFICPVPGCGSTFTRSFNLKGHIRSHNEEKPFLCHWPGCGKGFARQHDCKRHEQLHTNYRPFTCEGCNKPFARMDALNRHLRSEGGAECQRTLEANGTLPPSVNSKNSQTQRRNSPPSVPVNNWGVDPIVGGGSWGLKTEVPDSWSALGVTL